MNLPIRRWPITIFHCLNDSKKCLNIFNYLKKKKKNILNKINFKTKSPSIKSPFDRNQNLITKWNSSRQLNYRKRGGSLPSPSSLPLTSESEPLWNGSRNQSGNRISGVPFVLSRDLESHRCRISATRGPWNRGGGETCTTKKFLVGQDRINSPDFLPFLLPGGWTSPLSSMQKSQRWTVPTIYRGN